MHDIPSLSLLPHRSWQEILMEDWGGFQPPLTVHFPIHPAHSSDFVHVGPAMEVARLPVGAALDSHHQRQHKYETMLVQFAFGEVPCVPDFRRTRMTLEEGIYPVVRVEYYAYTQTGGVLYVFEYFCRELATPSRSPQSLLCMRGSATNLSETKQDDHIWVKVGFYPEDKVFPYHYAPYDWDASKFLPCECVSLEGKTILKNGDAVGRICEKDFSSEWEKERNFSEEDFLKYYEKNLRGTQTNPPYRSSFYTQVRDAIHLSATLEPNEKKSFELSFLTHYEVVEPTHRKDLLTLDLDIARQSVKKAVQELKPKDVATLVFPAQSWGKIFTYLPFNILQLLPRFEGVPGLLPTQGGSSERHYVWLGECVFMLGPLLKLGYFEPVREAIEFIFSLQDGGCPPSGRLVTTKGAVGTTGPRWLNATGMALALASDYYAYSRDEDYLSTYLPRILRAIHWIKGEIGATRQYLPDGSRPIYYGLMPFGCGTDGDYGYAVSYTDAYTFWGFEKAVCMLEQIGHENASDLREELEIYRKDIAEAVKKMTREDGFIERSIRTGDSEEIIYPGFDLTAGAFHLASGNALDVHTPSFTKYVDSFEKQIQGCFIGRMDYDTVYTGIPEWAWQQIYLKRREWKKAYALMQVNLKYGMTKTMQVQERFRFSDPRFTPWQPNGSGNGKVLDMIINAIYFEQNKEATLFGCVPFELLRQNKETVLSHLHTPRGKIHIRAVMKSEKHCSITLKTDTPGALPSSIRFPEHLVVVEPIKNQVHAVSGNTQNFIVTPLEN